MGEGEGGEQVSISPHIWALCLGVVFAVLGGWLTIDVRRPFHLAGLTAFGLGGVFIFVAFLW